MYKVLVIVPFPVNAEQLALRRAQVQAVRLGPDIAFDFRPVQAAPSNYVSHHDYILADVGIMEAGLRAQYEGYHAVCIDTMSDSGMAGLRSLLEIPVIAPGRASMLTALMFGERFSVLTMWSQWKPLYTKSLNDLGIQHKCASIRALDVKPDNRELLSGKEADIFPLLAEAGRRAIEEDGADVLLLGSTTMHQAHAYLAERLPVPVINPGPLTYKLAELALGLGLTHSRKAYPKPLTPKPELFEAMLAAAAASELGKQ
ncbi:MAG: hydrogenase expression protein HupH [Betaproteobacteria bacterium]|nr:hydrogenase expression protein HupH [Betaproteobacteria bacterium]